MDDPQGSVTPGTISISKRILGMSPTAGSWPCTYSSRREAPDDTASCGIEFLHNDLETASIMLVRTRPVTPEVAGSSSVGLAKLSDSFAAICIILPAAFFQLD